MLGQFICTRIRIDSLIISWSGNRAFSSSSHTLLIFFTIEKELTFIGVWGPAIKMCKNCSEARFEKLNKLDLIYTFAWRKRRGVSRRNSEVQCSVDMMESLNDETTLRREEESHNKNTNFKQLNKRI